MLKDNKGITLIALITTIIVLLILAAIGIRAGRDSIKEAKDNKLISELNMVQHAIFERYSKYKLTNDKFMLAGTQISYSEAQTKASEMGITIPQNIVYYKLNDKDLKNLGLELSDSKNTQHEESQHEYIVNYPNGIVMNAKIPKTNAGEPLYVIANTTIVSE